MAKKDIYYEPEDYIPEEVRKMFKVGEYNEEVNEEVRKLEEEKRANQSIRDFVNNK